MAAALGAGRQRPPCTPPTRSAPAPAWSIAAMAELLTREGPAAVRRLAALGAPFDRDAGGRFAQSLEAAHGRARVARVSGDRAGREIMRAVIAAVPGRAARSKSAPSARVRALLQDAAAACAAPWSSRTAR